RGEVQGMDLDGRMVYLTGVEGDSFINTDSTMISDNAFVFNGVQDVPQIMFLRLANLADEKYIMSLFVLENGDIKAEIKDSTIFVSGTKMNEQLNSYNAAKNTFLADKLSLNSKYKNSLQAMTRDIENAFVLQYRNIDKRERKYITTLIDNNKNNVLGAYLLVTNKHELSNRYKRDLLKRVGVAFKSYDGIAILEDEMVNYDKIVEGNIFTDVSLCQIDSSRHNLSEYVGKGNFLIVNFWASWSVPSVASISELKDLQKEFRAKGVSVLSISLDTLYGDWVSAVKQNYLWWPQLSDLKGWKGDAAKTYLVNSIPAFLLFNPDGTIITTEGDINDIREKLQQLFQ
ncbi:MAG: TlpA disulfide reductase family protein, partial [Bacteroidales bacterium]